MNVLILDDNVEFAYKIKNDLQGRFSTLCDKSYFDIFTDNFSHIPLRTKYDMAFLDIDLKEENGINLAKEIKQRGICKIIIFISSHAHLVYDSLTAQPYFFLRKSEYKNDLDVLFDLLGDSFEDHLFITLKYQGTKQVILVNDIIYVETVNHVLIFHTLNGEYQDNRLLKQFLNEVSQFNFVQIHKSFAINLDYLLNYTSTDVILAGRVNLSIGRTYKTDFIMKYQEYLIR